MVFGRQLRMGVLKHIAIDSSFQEGNLQHLQKH